MHAVKQRMRHLMGDDVMREAGKDQRPRRVMAVLPLNREVSKQHGLPLRAVIGVAVTQRVWIDPEPPHKGLAVTARCRVVLPLRRPERHAAERALEMADRRHRHRIHHLLVELRIGLRRRQPVLRQQLGVIKIDRGIDRIAGGVDVDHLDILADRPGLELLLPGNPDGHFGDADHIMLPGEAGIEGVDAQPPRRGRRQLLPWRGCGHMGDPGKGKSAGAGRLRS